MYIGTDGGLRHTSGAFSWILCSPGREKLVCNAGPVDGWKNCQSSLRSEAAALASVMLYLDELAAWATVLIQCRFKFFVYSKSAMSNVHLLRDLIPKRRCDDNADILSHMRSAHHVVSRFSLEHVKSHQDDTTDFDKLPFPAQLNVLCDRMATNQLKRQSANNWEATQSNPFCPRSIPVEVSYGRQVISSHYIARLRDEIGLDSHRTYLQTKYQWSDQTWALVAWESLEKCARHSATTNQTNRSKLMHKNWLNLGTQRARHGLGSPESVERCMLSLLSYAGRLCTSVDLRRP